MAGYGTLGLGFYWCGWWASMEESREPLLEHHHVVNGEGSLNPGRGAVCGDGCGLSDPEDLARRKSATRKLSVAIVFCLLFMLVEVGGGFFANSLAILTDAAHLLSDVASFAISLFAIYASGWDATPKQSYGFHRVEILGALVSIHIIWLITGILVYEAITRFIHGTNPVDGRLMFIIATLGLLVNVGMMLVLGHDHGGAGHSHAGHSHGEKHDHDHDHNHNHSDHAHEHHHPEAIAHSHNSEHGKKCNSINIRVESNSDAEVGLKDKNVSNVKLDKDLSNKGSINVRGAYLHVLGDLIQSIGVMIAGAIIWYKPEWKVVDLICTLLFSVLVLLTTVGMWKEISEVLMESTPREIDATRLEEGLKKIGSVQAVHELHIWAITLGKILLACHVKIERDADADEVLRNVIQYCEQDFKISHVTIQIERD